jgi:hypothetical protein
MRARMASTISQPGWSEDAEGAPASTAATFVEGAGGVQPAKSVPSVQARRAR